VERFALAAAPGAAVRPSARRSSLHLARIERGAGSRFEYRDVPQESLAREEAEAWEVMRVDATPRFGQQASDQSLPR
jgi:hypothetical protein